MNSVGIDVSKGRSTIAVMRPFGEVVISPFEVRHTVSELSELARLLKSLDGETRVIMEATGNYHTPVAKLLHDAGLYVSVINAKLVRGYGNNDLRRVKTDKKDAIKLANYGLDRWLTLPRYIPEEDTRLLLKNCCRQYRQYSKVQTILKNNLISLLDNVFPNANRLFSSPARVDGSEKWVDFVAEFWHCKCVCERPEKAFINKYRKWCRKHGYNFSEEKARDIYSKAGGYFGVMPKSETTKLLVEQAVSQLRATSAALAALKQEMLSLASKLPEYPIVMKMFGVGPTLGPQLIAEIGDVRRFYSKKALVAYAGIDAPPNDSGDVTGRHKSMSKVGSSSLRRTLFLVMSVYLQNSPPDEPVYQFMDRKRAEGKPYRVYMMASANKFLRIYYATVKAYLGTLDHALETEIRKMLKTYHRQYGQYLKLKVSLKTNLITLLDEVFPGVNTLFASAPRKSDAHEKWVDFAREFWHRECVCGRSESVFAKRYQKWCSRHGYRFCEQKAIQIYETASSHPSTLPKTEDTKRLITYAVDQLNAITETLSSIQNEMLSLASGLPEFPMVMGMFGVGETLGPQLMAEIGDIQRFERKQSLVAFAGVDAPPYQSGTFESQKRHISKRGSPRLRKTLFQVMNTILQHAPADNPVYQFLDRKRAEGKHYYVYMTAGANKFLRIYYGTVKAYLQQLDC